MNPLAIGALLVEQGAVLPSLPGIRSTPYFDGWNVIANSAGTRVEEAIAAAGWTFLFEAGEVVTTAFGGSKNDMMHRALRRVVRGKRPGLCNCVEITSIDLRDVFWRPHIGLGVHWRRIQESRFPVPDAASEPRNTDY
ncbi:MAG: hypothetical protein ABSB15_25755 [Bryobacteraceae bacterium]|jgi:hypothetical protein